MTVKLQSKLLYPDWNNSPSKPPSFVSFHLSAHFPFSPHLCLSSSLRCWSWAFSGTVDAHEGDDGWSETKEWRDGWSDRGSWWEGVGRSWRSQPSALPLTSWDGALTGFVCVLMHQQTLKLPGLLGNEVDCYPYLLFQWWPHLWSWTRVFCRLLYFYSCFNVFLWSCFPTPVLICSLKSMKRRSETEAAVPAPEFCRFFLQVI